MRDELPLDWRDSYSIRAGGEYRLGSNDILRGGYTYTSNPVPDRTLTPLLPATIEHAISAGYGHRFGCLEIDFAYQFSFGRRRKVGRSGIIGGDFDGSSDLTMAHLFFLGAGVRFGDPSREATGW